MINICCCLWQKVNKFQNCARSVVSRLYWGNRVQGRPQVKKWYTHTQWRIQEFLVREGINPAGGLGGRWKLPSVVQGRSPCPPNAINISYTLKWVICSEIEIIINKFDRMNGRPKFWWGGGGGYRPIPSPLDPPLRPIPPLLDPPLRTLWKLFTNECQKGGNTQLL